MAPIVIPMINQVSGLRSKTVLLDQMNQLVEGRAPLFDS